MASSICLGADLSSTHDAMASYAICKRPTEITRQIETCQKLILAELARVDRWISSCNALFENKETSIHEFREYQVELDQACEKTIQFYQRMNFPSHPFATVREKAIIKQAFEARCGKLGSGNRMFNCLTEKWLGFGSSSVNKNHHNNRRFYGISSMFGSPERFF